MEDNLGDRAEQIIRHQAILLELAKQEYSDLDSALKRITEADSKTLGVERVSVWFFDKDHTEIICEVLYQLSKNSYAKGLRLQVKQYPQYFQALEESRTIAANDAPTDSRTNEFAEGYLKPFGISSMMDVAIRLHGKVIGIVCHEHTGPKKEWTLEEQEFAASIADTVSLTFEALEHKKLDKELQESEVRYRALFEQAADAIVLIDPQDGALVEFNNKAHKQLGYTREEFKNLKISDIEVIETAEEVSKHIEKILKQGTGTFETKQRTKDGHIRDILVSAEVISIRGRKIIQAIFRDITERKKAEKKLEKLNQELLK
jgi:PAS domain S-box-containing protein